MHIFGLMPSFYLVIFYINFLFQMALNKPSGLQVLPGGLFQQRTVLKQLQWEASKFISSSSDAEASTLEDQHPVPVHRLGRGTSGVQYFTRNSGLLKKSGSLGITGST